MSITKHTGPYRVAYVDPLPVGSGIEKKPFDDLKKGDVFALEEPDGSAVPGIWLALEDAKDGAINCEETDWRLNQKGA